MIRPEFYRAKAKELRAKAQEEHDPVLQADGERLAASYENLADQLSAAEEDAQPTHRPKKSRALVRCWHKASNCRL